MRSSPLALVVLLLSGCGGSEYQDLRDFVKNSGADMRGKLDPAPEVRPYEFVAYNNDTNLPNPFKPRKQDLRSGGGGGLHQPNRNRPKEALEEFPLESLKMVGYLYQNKVGWAVIRATDNKLYRVKAGNHIGLNYGLITGVTDSSVMIKESVQDSTGDWSESDNSLQLE